MQGVALRRNNSTNVGSAEAGPKVAAVLSVAETGHRLGIDLRAYPADVLTRPAATSIQPFGQLTPAGWAASQGA